MALRGRSVCGIEIGRDLIGIVQFVPEENSVAGIAIQPLDVGGRSWWENVQSEFRSLVSAMKLTGEDAVCSLPSETAVIKTLMLDADEGSLDEALEWELGQQIVDSIDEYAFDYEKTGSAEQEATSRFLVAACRYATLDRASALLKTHKLNPLAVDLDIFALVNVFEANYRDRLSTPSLLVLGGEEYTKVVLTVDGGFVDYEVFGYDAQSLEPRSYAARLRRSCTKLLDVSGRAGGRPAPTYLTGPLYSHGDVAQESLEAISGSEVLSPFRNVGCRAIAESDMDRYAPQLAISVGLAVREQAGARPV
jgi:Tfp pilus assembly PilM family ATPase